MGVYRQPDNKGGAAILPGFNFDFPAMFINDYGMGDRQPLPGSATRFLGGEKQVEYAMPDFLRDAVPGVADPNFSPMTVKRAADLNRAPFR